MEAIGLKQTLLSTINNVDESNTALLEKLVHAVKSILKQNHAEQTEDGITPFVKSMEVGIKLPENLDIKAERDIHYKENTHE